MCRQSGKADCIEESDLSLILKCRGGSQTAAAALLARYAGLLHHAVSKTVVEGSDPEDLLQEAYMGLLNAIRTYDPERGVLFRTYAHVCVGNSLKNMRAASMTKKSRLHLDALSFDEMGDCGFDEDGDPEGLYISRETVTEVERLIDRTLSPYEKEVFFLYLNGCGYESAATKLHSSLKSVDNALQRARRKLKAVLNDL